MATEKIEFLPGLHNGESVIKILFEYDKTLIERVKKIDARWSARMKCWYVPDTEEFRLKFKLAEHIVSEGMFLSIGKDRVAYIWELPTMPLPTNSPSTKQKTKGDNFQTIISHGDK